MIKTEQPKNVVSKFQHFIKSARNSTAHDQVSITEEQKAALVKNIQVLLHSISSVEESKAQLQEIKSYDSLVFFENFSDNGYFTTEQFAILFDIIALDSTSSQIASLISRHDKNMDSKIDYSEYLGMTETKPNSQKVTKYRAGLLNNSIDTGHEECQFGYGPNAEYEIGKLRDMFYGLLVN